VEIEVGVLQASVSGSVDCCLLQSSGRCHHRSRSSPSEPSLERSVSGVENGAEWAKKSVERSGERESEKKRAERSAEGRSRSGSGAVHEWAESTGHGR